MAEEEEKVVAEGEAPAAEAPAAEEADKKPLTEKDLKKVAKPDETVLKERIAVEDAKIVELQARLTGIKESLDSHESGRGEPNSELAIAKSKYNELRQESRRLQQEKRNIHDQISAADELKKQQQDLTQRLRSELTFFSVEEIDRKIKALEHQQQTSSLSIKEDKKMMEEIKKLSTNKPMIKQYDEAQESLKGVREHHNNLYTQLKAKNAELSGLKEVEDKHRAEMDDARAKEEAKRSDIPGLFKERDGIRAKLTEHREEIKKIRDEFNEQRREFMTYQKALREIRNSEWLKQKAARQAYYDEERRKREEEEAKRDPWEEEKLICEQLISWVGKYLPKKVEEVAAASSVEAPAGVKLHRAKSSLEDDDDPYAAVLKTKKGKKKGAKPDAPKATKITLAPEDFGLWDKLGFKAPSQSSECPALYEQLLEKREWLKTAPPKPKKKSKEEIAKEEAAAKEAAKAEEDAAKAEAAAKEEVAAPAFDEAADLKKKQEEAARKAAEAAKAEDERNKKAQELESSGKKAAGGLHKFDASEVDVYGGEATADDLMDAFGFGGADGEEITEEDGAAEPAPAAAPAFDEAADLKKKQEEAARKAAEAAKAEDERNKKAQELESSGKKAAGGLHKFDASEVDVYGGEGTADDLMDAFGFGDGDGMADAVEEDGAEPAPAPVANGTANGTHDMISIQALSESQVKVALHL